MILSNKAFNRLGLSFQEERNKKEMLLFILILCCRFDQQRTKINQVYFTLKDIPLEQS